MDKVTFESCGQIVTAHIGRRQNVRRTEGDVCLSRQIAIGLPIKVTILINISGQIVVWDVNWCQKSGNNYWHFDCGSEEYAFGRAPLWPNDQAIAGHDPTPAQRVAIARLFFDRTLADGFGGYMGAPPQRWCKFDGTEELERLGGSTTKQYYA